MEQSLGKEVVGALKPLIHARDKQQALELIGSYHAADIAELYDMLELDEVIFIFFLLEGEKAADVFLELEDNDREKIIESLPDDFIVSQFIENMDSDDAADLVGSLEDDRQEKLLSLITDTEQAGDIVDLLVYEEDSAGGLMAKELIQINENWSMAKAVSEIRKQAEDVSNIFHVYVVDDSNLLKGVLPLKQIILNPEVDQIKQVANKDVITVKTDDTREDVASIIEKYDLVSLPVVDSIGRLVGRITVDDVVDVIKEEAEKDYQMASGLSGDVETRDKVARLVRGRFPWLLIGLVGGIASSWVVKLFTGNLAANPQLAIFIPLIAAMGGNTGIQSSAIVVQGLANNVDSYKDIWGKLGKELLVALSNSLILSIILFSYNMAIGADLGISLSVSMSLFIVIIVASLFGMVIPLALNRLKIDPAVATGPFITTSNDIIGLLIYFLISGLATAMLI